MISVEFTNRQRMPIDPQPLIVAIHRVFENEGIKTAEISLAIVSDAEIHEVNRRFLQHDQPTDVISFVLDKSETTLAGEIVASYETAEREASRYGWEPAAELLLYVIHGALHLAGYDDLDASDRRVMRDQERRYLASFQLEHRYDTDEAYGE
ncbi:MAG: rRNA maturation RNase YbeY [Planctomycetes bacterium]|nr:rRNA maturation RNase YbeY [Planctomycetota bacterium]